MATLPPSAVKEFPDDSLEKKVYTIKEKKRQQKKKNL